MNKQVWKLVVATCLGIALLSACGGAPELASAPTGGPQALVSVPTSAPTQCPQEEVLPTITEVRPDEIHPGDEVTVGASGGYLRDTCGGYNESARSYKIFLDDEPAGDLSCYVNHCEGKFRLPPDAAIGDHCLGVQKGTCQMELVVE